MFTAVCEAQSRVISPTAIPLVSLGTVMGASLVGLTVAHGIGLRAVCWLLLTIRLRAFAPFGDLKRLVGTEVSERLWK